MDSYEVDVNDETSLVERYLDDFISHHLLDCIYTTKLCYFRQSDSDISTEFMAIRVILGFDDRGAPVGGSVKTFTMKHGLNLFFQLTFHSY